ncbi:hypothetical protein K443DRAFT_15156 [Laccaria amethystina LaAM-08-1]|uniref:Kinesin light chain n=1 Tax=Laccaria amethystina LaAM-08-1 TaxID=1095629 RepID=A0A0C9WH38_9AGAR|nr:hypothetical protein K443DRAFT_15156 [Laccaria amethystina LaAM-08-1]
MANLASTYSYLEKYKEAEKLQIQALEASSKVLGGGHPHTISAMTNLAAIHNAISQSMNVDDAENEVFNTSPGVSVTQGMEEGNVDPESLHASNWVLSEDYSHAVEPPVNYPSINNVCDRVLLKRKRL